MFINAWQDIEDFIIRVGKRELHLCKNGYSYSRANGMEDQNNHLPYKNIIYEADYDGIRWHKLKDKYCKKLGILGYESIQNY